MKRPIASRRAQLLARSALCGVLGAMAIGASSAAAQVTGVGTVTSTTSNGGAVGVASGGGVTDITTNASRSIVNWTNLTVTPTEALNFYFNNRSDIVVNRVAGPASVDGILNGCMATCATKGGNIWILSAGGVLFGANAQVNTGGFLASTGSLADLDILDGDMNFAFTSAPTNSAIIVANGASLNTNGGSLALIAPIVTTNAGSTVTATNGGDVIYGSAENYNVTFAPTGTDDLDLLTFQVPSQSDGSGGTPGLTLNGTTVANQVFAAIVSKASVASSILLGGNITATTASGENGDIVLSAGAGFTNGVGNSPMGFDGSITQNTTATLTGVNVTMRAADSIVADEINASDRVWLNSEWTSISQTGAITANRLRAEAGGDIILTNTGNDFNFLSYIEAQGVNGIDIVDLDGFEINDYIFHLGGGTRTASLTALTGSITQTSGGVIQVGTLNVSAAGGAIDLGVAASNTTNLGTITAGAGDFSYRSLLDVNVAGVVTASNVTLSSLAGQITQSGTGSILTGQLRAFASSGVSLNSALNDVDTVFQLTSGSGDVTYTDADGFDLTGTVSGVAGVNLTAGGTGAITQSAGTITAGTLTASAGGSITLGQINQVADIGGLTAGGAGDIVYRDADDFTLTGSITAAGDDITLLSDAGSISQTGSGAITANRLTASAAGSITIYDGVNNVATIGGFVSTGGDIVYRDVDSFDIQGNVTANSTVNRGVMLVAGGAGSIAQTSGVFDVGYFRGIAQSGITLGGANLIRRLISTQISNGTLTLNTTTDLSVDGTVSANAVSLTTTGAITQAANAQIWTTTLSASAVTGINLTSSGFGANNIGNLGVITNTTSGGVTIANAYPFMNLTGNITAAGQAVSISNAMAGINQTGGIITAGALSMSAAGGISLAQNNDVGSFGAVTAAGNVTIVNVGALTLTDNVNTGGGDLSLTSTTGAITQSGGVITANVLNLSAGGSGGISLNRANAAASLGVVTANGHVLFRNDGNTVVGGDITATGFDVTLRSNTGSITQTTGSDITSNSLQVIAQTGITLTNLGNAINQLAWVDNFGSGGFAFRQTNGFQIVGPVMAGGQVVSLTSLSGAITQNSGSILQAGTLNASAAGTLTLNEGNNVGSLGVISTGGSFLFRDLDGFDLTGNITAANQLVMLAQSGSITQTGGIITADSINAMASVDLLLGGVNVINSISSLAAGNDLLYRQVGSLSLPAISVGGALSLYSTTGSLTQTGAWVADVFNGGAATGVTLNNAGNDFDAVGGLSNTTSGNITLTDADGFDLTGAITTSGAQSVNLAVVAGGITQQAAASITTGSLTLNTTAGAILVGLNDIDALGAILAGPSFSFNDIDGFDIDGAVQAVNVNLTSGGAISESPGGAIFATNLSLTAASATLDSDNDIINLGDVNVTGNMTFRDNDSTLLTGQITVGGTLQLTSNIGDFAQGSGSVLDIGRLQVSAALGINLMESANIIDVLGAVTTSFGDVMIATTGDLQIDGLVSAAALGEDVIVQATGDMTMTASGSVFSGGNIALVSGGDMVLNDVSAAFGTWNVSAFGSVTTLGTSDIDVIAFLGTAGEDIILSGGASLSILSLGAVSAGGAFTVSGDAGGLVLTDNITAADVVLSTAAAGLNQAGGVITATTASLTSVGGGSITANMANAIGTVSLNGGTVVFTNAGSFAGNVILGDAVTLTSISGKITQTALTGRIVADSLTASAATGLEFFGGQNDIAFLAGLSSTAGGVTYRDMGGFDITGNITAAGQSVELISDATGADGDDIVQSGGVITANRLNGNSSGDFLLTRANAVANLGLLNANGAFTFRNAGSITLVDNLSAGSVLTLISDNNGIMQNGGVITAPTLNASSALGIALTRLNDVDALGDIDGGVGAFSFRDTDDLDLAGDITADTGVTLQTAGALSQSGGSLVTANLQLFSNAAAILNGANNDIDNLGSTNVLGDLSFSDIDGFTIDAGVRSGSTMTLVATTGDIVELTGGALDAQVLNVTATTGEIDLAGDNAVIDLGDITAAGDITFHNTIGFTLSGDITGAAVRLTAAAGAINQTAGSIVGDSLYASAFTGLNLASAGNDVDDITGLVNATSGGISFQDSDSVNIDGAVTASGQTVNFDVGGDLNQSVAGIITARRVQGSAVGAFGLADTANVVDELGPITANSIAFATTTGLVLTGALNSSSYVELKAETELTQTAAGTITGDTLRAQADGDIILDQANDLNSILLLYSDLGDVAFNDIDGFQLDPAVFGDIWASGTMTLSSVAGDITQSTAGLRATTLIASAGGDIILDQANQVVSLGAMTAGGGISYTDLDDVALTGNVTTGAANVFAINSITGAVAQTAGLITASWISGEAAGDFSLNNFAANLGDITSTAGDIDISNANDILLDGLLSTGAGHGVSLTSDGGIDQSATGAIQTGTLTLSAGTSIQLTGAAGNDIDALAGVVAGTTFAYTDTDDFALTGDITVDGVGGPTVSLASLTGRIDQTGGVITADHLVLATATGADLSRANMINRLEMTNGVTGDMYFVNAQELQVLGATSGGLVDIRTTSGTLGHIGVIDAGSISLTGAENVLAFGLLQATGDISVAALDGQVIAFNIISGDDVFVTATNGFVQVANITMNADSDGEGDGQNLTISATGNAFLGATSEAGVTAGNALRRAAGAGTINITSANGSASVFADLLEDGIDILSAGGVTGRATLYAANGDAHAGTVSGYHVSLKAANGLVDPTTVDIRGGDYTLYGEDFSTGAFGFTGLARDISITDTFGDLTIDASMAAGRNLTVDVLSGSLLDGTGSTTLVAGTGGSGDLLVEADNIAMSGIGAGGDVTLDVGVTGDVSVGLVVVFGDYNLTGGSFSTGALTPIGFMGGTWTITDGGGFDFSGQTLTYNGDIAIHAADVITGGDVQSIFGSILIDSLSDIDVEGLYAATDITVDSANDLTVGSATSSGGDISLTGRSVTVQGFADAANDVVVLAEDGAADVESATAGGDIIVVAVDGDARLGQAIMTGAAGNLGVFATNGNATLGATDYTTIVSNNYLQRAAGSTGSVSVTSVGGRAAVYLDHSDAIDVIGGDDVDVTVENGDLAIGVMMALNGDIYAEALDGNFTLGNAIAGNGGVDLYAFGGGLTLGGSIYGALGVRMETDGLLNGSAAVSIDTGGDLDLVGGSVVLDSITADGSITVVATDGAAYVEFANAGGSVQVGAFDGDATLRGAEAPDGIAVFATNTATFGADDRSQITAANYGITGGGCGCGLGAGIVVVSLDGDVVVNLQSVTGGFDVIGAAIDGDATVFLATGDLTIGDLAAFNIDIEVAAGSLETAFAVTSGGNYRLKAQDFLGDVLNPTLFFGTLGDYTVIDTLGGLDMTGVSILAQGDILIDVQAGGALTGDAQFSSVSGTGEGDVTITAEGISLGSVEADRDVVLNAGFGGVDVANSVSIGRDYTLYGQSFSAAALTPLGARVGTFNLSTFGSLDYSAGVLSYGGDITLNVFGALVGGDITSATGNILIVANGIDSGALSAANGAILATSSAGDVVVSSATALGLVDLSTGGGNVALGAAALLGTGANTLRLNSDGGGRVTLGAPSAGAIGTGHVFTSAGSSTTAALTAVGGDAFVNLDRSHALTSVFGAGDVGITVRNGDFAVGLIDAGGRVDVDGPTGELTIDGLFAATDADIRGGDVILRDGEVGQNLTLDATGDIDFRTNGVVEVTGEISLTAGGRVSQDANAGLMATGLTVDAGDAVNLAGVNQIEVIRGVDVAAGGFVYRSGRPGGFDIAGTINAAGQTVDLRSLNGGISQSGGAIVAGRLTGASDGGVWLAGGNLIDELGDFANTGGAFFLNVDQALSIVGTVDSAAALRIQSGAMTIASTGTVRSATSGDAVVLASDGVFTNNGGADGVQAENGRWLIYSQAAGNPGGSTSGNNFGGLAGRSYYGSTYDFGSGAFSATPNAGNRFVYAYQPTLAVTPISQRITYNGQIPTLGALIAGLINGDLAGNAWSGAPTLSGAVSKNVGTYGLSAALGSLLSDMNYAFSFGSGTLIIDPKALTGTVTANNKTYDGATNATGSISLGGVVAGDAVVATATGFRFADRNAGLGKIVTALGAGLSGADAGNYTLGSVGTAVADILRRSLTGVLAANNKTYDGTTAATGSIGLTGVVAGDLVSASGTFTFADRNAGVGKVVNVTGLALSGADAANYDLGPISGVADILRRSIGGTVVANNKTYDGSTAATGSIDLTGVIAGDDIRAGGTLSFDNRNAGVGRSVGAVNAALSGADAGNYTLTGVANGIADILRRAISITAGNQSKRFGQGDPSLTYVVGGGLVAGDVLTGGLVRAAGELAGVYVIGQGTLAASSNYILTFTPGEFVIQIPPAGGVQSLQMLRDLGESSLFALDRDPSPGLIVGDGDDARDPDDQAGVLPTAN